MGPIISFMVGLPFDTSSCSIPFIMKTLQPIFYHRANSLGPYFIYVDPYWYKLAHVPHRPTRHQPAHFQRCKIRLNFTFWASTLRNDIRTPVTYQLSNLFNIIVPSISIDLRRYEILNLKLGLFI